MIQLPIHSPVELAEATSKLYKTGLPRGDAIGWMALREFYSVALSQCTFITGYPGSGKSEWLDAVMINLALNHDWRFAVYSPENYPHELHISKLLEKYVGKPFGLGPTERMSEGELAEAMEWVMDHFMFLNPRQKDYRSLLEAAVKFRSAAEKFGVVMDPWNALESLCPPGVSETRYIGDALTELSQWVREHRLHAWIVAHPSKMMRENGGSRPVPTPYDIHGSAHWFNKADNIITVHRPDMANDIVEIHVQKVRFKYLGRVGAAQLRYDRVTGRYFDLPKGYMQDVHDEPEERDSVFG